MNAIEAQRMSVGADAVPRCVLVQIASVYDWLYREMIRELRAAHGTRFIFLTRGELWKERYGDLVTQADSVFDLSPVESETAHGDGAAVEIASIARAYEARYGLVYMRDIIQQERQIATRFLPSSPFYAVPGDQATEQGPLTRRINAYFAAFEALFAREPIDLVLARPDSLYGVPLAAVAADRRVATTFPDVAKYKGLITWAHGAYRGSGLIRAAYDALPPGPTEHGETAEDVRYADKDFRDPRAAGTLGRVAARMLHTSLDRILLIFDSLKHGRWGRRSSFRAEILRLANSYRIARWLERNARRPSGGAEAPYVLFLLPVEPEFNTHSLAREFCNSMAIVQQLALCLPAGYRLVVKEHSSNLGNRRLDYYRDLAKFPNLVFTHHHVPGTVLARGAVAVATISGTIGMEVSLIPKPVLVFSTRTIYGFLPHVRVVTSMYDLPEALAWAVRPRSAAEQAEIRAAGARFYAALQAIGFPAAESPLFKGSRRELDPEARTRAHAVLLETFRLQKRDFVAAAAARPQPERASL